jgi:hypothetical protein
MSLALAIVFLWLGGLLLFIAFHPLDTAVKTPGDLVDTVREDIDKNDNAYSL